MWFLDDHTKADLSDLLHGKGALRWFAHAHPYTLAILASAAAFVAGAVAF